jgi:hypothetical protein
MKNEPGCMKMILFPILGLVSLFIVVWITGGCEDVMSDEFTDAIDTWPEVFAVLLYVPIYYLLLRWTGVLKNDDLE